MLSTPSVAFKARTAAGSEPLKGFKSLVYRFGPRPIEFWWEGRLLLKHGLRNSGVVDQRIEYPGGCPDCEGSFVFRGGVSNAA